PALAYSLLSTVPRPPTSTLFPYTTLFRSGQDEVNRRRGHEGPAAGQHLEGQQAQGVDVGAAVHLQSHGLLGRHVARGAQRIAVVDRKSTRLNSSHQIISYAVFCLKKKKQQ